MKETMAQYLQTLTAYSICAKDGSLGTTRSFLFDERSMDVRYLIVKTGPWLGTEVVLSPHVIRRVVPGTTDIHVDLTCAQVRKAPSVDTQKPFSRQMEEALAAHYAWPLWFTAPASALPGNWKPRREDPHLRSTKAILGYQVEATDESAGKVHDMWVNTESWEVESLVLDTRPWWPASKKVLVSTSEITRIVYADSRVHVATSREDLQGRSALRATTAEAVGARRSW